MLQEALTLGVDACWLVDADVLCDPTTLQSLGDCEAPIVAGVYWTHWQAPQPGVVAVQHAGPQVWLRHPYNLSGRGLTEPEFRALLVQRQLVQVGGLGACTLFSRAAIEKGVNFAPVPEGLPAGPMGDGEDRHLCERARRLHLPLFADSWPDIWHAYHAAEHPEIPAWLARLSAPHLQRPVSGALVSFKIEPLEPAPHPLQPGVLQHLPMQFGRGRLGSMKVLPELEEALGSMQVGERQIVSLHFPAHYPYPSLRGQQRLVALTLFDAKAYRLPPVVERELFVGNHTGAVVDATTLTAPQLDSVLETADAR